MLPLPVLIASLLCMRSQPQQAKLDSFLASVCGTGGLHSEASDRSLAQARDCLHAPALTALNDLVVERAEQAAVVR